MPEIYQADAPEPEPTPAPGLPDPTDPASNDPLPPPTPSSSPAVDGARELAASRMEEALSRQEQYRARLAEMPNTATGEELEGDIRVTVDQQGLLSDITYGAAVAELPPEQIVELTMSAIHSAHTGLQRPAPSPDAATRLHDDTVAEALLVYTRKESE